MFNKKTGEEQKTCGHRGKLFPDVVDPLSSGALSFVAGLAKFIKLHHSLEDFCKLFLLIIVADALQVHKVVRGVPSERAAEYSHLP